MPIQRPVAMVDTSPQLELFPGGESISGEEERPELTSGVNFKRSDPREWFVRGDRLEEDRFGDVVVLQHFGLTAGEIRGLQSGNGLRTLASCRAFLCNLINDRPVFRQRNRLTV